MGFFLKKKQNQFVYLQNKIFGQHCSRFRTHNKTDHTHKNKTTKQQFQFFLSMLMFFYSVSVFLGFGFFDLFQRIVTRSLLRDQQGK